MTRKQVAVLLFVLGIAPAVLALIGMGIAMLFDCGVGTGACTLMQTQFGKIVFGMNLSGWWVVVTAPLAVIGSAMMLVLKARGRNDPWSKHCRKLPLTDACPKAASR